jgi:hypothetical protein
MNYDGHAVFPLAYAQAVGCLVMGFALGLKESIGQMCVLPCPLYMMMISFYITQGMGRFTRLLRQVQLALFICLKTLLLSIMQDSVAL